MAEVVVTAHVIARGKAEKHGLPSGARIIELLKEMDINPEAVVVRRNGKIVAEEERLADGDEIEIISIVSGG